MATTLGIWVNTSNTDSPFTGVAPWYQVASNDYLIFSAGSSVVINGAAIPTQTQLNQAGVVLTGSQQNVPYYFLADVNSNLLRQIPLMGNVNAQYVMAFVFSGATASEPILELWDDATYLTANGTTLGAGTASQSWWRGITTTSGASGSNWSGSTLAGASSSHYLLLNNGSGALTVATNLYCNLKIVVPASATTGTSATPVFVSKFASN